jgi:hypothetical protein
MAAVDPSNEPPTAVPPPADSGAGITGTPEAGPDQTGLVQHPTGESASPPAVHRAGTDDRPTVELPRVDQTLAEQTTVEQPRVEQGIADRPTVEQPVLSQVAADPPNVEQPVRRQTTADPPAAEQPLLGQTTADPPTAEQSIIPGMDRDPVVSVSDQPDSRVPGGHRSDGDQAVGGPAGSATGDPAGVGDVGDGASGKGVIGGVGDGASSKDGVVGGSGKGVTGAVGGGVSGKGGVGGGKGAAGSGLRQVIGFSMLGILVAFGACLLVVAILVAPKPPPGPGEGSVITDPGEWAPPRQRSEPVRVLIPAIGMDAPLSPMGLAGDGTLEVPPITQPQLAGWFREGPTPGEAGNAVLLGHADTSTAGPAVFYSVGALNVGELVLIVRADGTLAHFQVNGVQAYRKSEFPTELVYGPSSTAGLRLITCGGVWDEKQAAYLDNVVVFASLAAWSEPR